jgi:hypothetical protein
MNNGKWATHREERERFKGDLDKIGKPWTLYVYNISMIILFIVMHAYFIVQAKGIIDWGDVKTFLVVIEGFSCAYVVFNIAFLVMVRLKGC